MGGLAAWACVCAVVLCGGVVLPGRWWAPAVCALPGVLCAGGGLVLFRLPCLVLPGGLPLLLSGSFSFLAFYLAEVALVLGVPGLDLPGGSC